MKKVGDIMKEMGFRKDAPDSVKEAFIKHLIKSATGIDVETPSEKRARVASASSKAKQKPKSSQVQPVQLAFDFAKADEKEEAS